MSLVLNESELIYAQNTHFMDRPKFSAQFRRNKEDSLRKISKDPEKQLFQKIRHLGKIRHFDKNVS